MKTAQAYGLPQTVQKKIGEIAPLAFERMEFLPLSSLSEPMRALSSEIKLVYFDPQQAEQEAFLALLPHSRNHKNLIILLAQDQIEWEARIYGLGLDQILVAPFRPSDWLRLSILLSRGMGSQTPPAESHNAAPRVPGSPTDTPIVQMASASPVEGPKPDLIVHMLGGLQLINPQNGQVWSVSQKKIRSLLAYFLYNDAKEHRKEHLMDLFWPLIPASCARNSLNVALHAVRKELQKILPGQKVILFRNDRYFLNPELVIEKDVDHFSELCKQYEKLADQQPLELDKVIALYTRARNFYKGNLFEDMEDNEWCSTERISVQEKFMDLHEKQSQLLFETDRMDACIEVCRKMVELNPCWEDAHRRLMECYLKKGQRDRALRQYQMCSRLLQNELQLQPDEVTRSLYLKINYDSPMKRISNY